MGIHEVEFDDGAVELHWLFVVKLGCKRMMRCHGQTARRKRTLLFTTPPPILRAAQPRAMLARNLRHIHRILTAMRAAL